MPSRHATPLPPPKAASEHLANAHELLAAARKTAEASSLRMTLLAEAQVEATLALAVPHVSAAAYRDAELAALTIPASKAQGRSARSPKVDS